MGKNPENYRKAHLAIRDAMTQNEVHEKSSMIVRRLVCSEWYQSSKEIFLYYPLKNEVDCTALAEQAWRDQKRTAFPLMAAGCQMNFFYVTSFEELSEGRFHVMEPLAECRKAEPNDQPVLVPGIAFGFDGNRYGYGKGYYDRFFARYPHLKKYGICFENQLESSLPAGTTDVPMDRIYTESEEIVLKWN